MRFLGIGNMDEKEAAALAHYRASQQQQRQPSPGASSPRQSARRTDASPERDHVGQPVPRGSRLPERESGDARQPVLVNYTVQRGDTLRGIADWFYGDRSRWVTIYAANRSTIRDPQAIEAGSVLRIPVLKIPRQGGSKPLA